MRELFFLGALQSNGKSFTPPQPTPASRGGSKAWEFSLMGARQVSAAGLADHAELLYSAVVGFGDVEQERADGDFFAGFG